MYIYNSHFHPLLGRNLMKSIVATSASSTYTSHSTLFSTLLDRPFSVRVDCTDIYPYFAVFQHRAFLSSYLQHPLDIFFWPRPEVPERLRPKSIRPSHLSHPLPVVRRQQK